MGLVSATHNSLHLTSQVAELSVQQYGSQLGKTQLAAKEPSAPRHDLLVHLASSCCWVRELTLVYLQVEGV
jgi:hypothetical protein